MSQITHPIPDAVPPEWLAGYADGELDARQRAAVEARVATSAEARAELDVQIALSPKHSPMYRQTAPSHPSSGRWKAVIAAAHERAANRPTPAPVRRRPVWAAVASGALAASLALLYVSGLPTRGPDVVTDPALPVALASDVSILSIHDADAERLVVGVPPVSGPIQLASPNDAVVEQPVIVQQNPPKAGTPGPMIVTPTQPVP